MATDTRTRNRNRNRTRTKRHEFVLRRRQLGFTQEQVAERLQVAVTTVRGWEGGWHSPRIGFMPRIARLFQVSLVEAQRWFDDSKAVPDGLTVPEWLGHFAALEQGAAELWTYQPVTVPALLQTATYAAAVQRQEAGPPSPAAVDQWVRHRLLRQDVLRRQPEPLRLSAVIDESVLWRVAGDGEIMADQLDRLIELAEWDNVELRVLPLDRGVHMAAFGSFTLLRSPGALDPYMAVVGDMTTAHYLELPSVVEAHADLYRRLRDMARSASESIDLIRTLAKERYHP
jgi:transcriptional regulator with XRE-family HTH domain